MYNLESFQRLVKKYGQVGVIHLLERSNFNSEQTKVLESIKILIDGSPNTELIFSLC